jgi:V/A-type H+-transporting ATPase subunit C
MKRSSPNSCSSLVFDMDYPFAIGVIKAIEDKLLDRAQYAKLAKTPKSEFVATLLSFGYGKGTSEPNVEALIQTELQSVRQLLDALTPDKSLTDLFYLVYDATLLKALYKELLFGIPCPRQTEFSGAFPADLLEQAVLNHDRAPLPKLFQTLLKNIDNAVEAVSDNPRLVSAAIDNALLAFAIRQLRFPKPQAFLTYLLAFIDFQNVLTIERSKLLGWSQEAATSMLLDNGSIPKSVFLEAFQASTERYLASLQPYYNEELTRQLKKNQEKASVETLEKALSDLLLEQVKPFRHDAFSIGPIIYYYLKKKAEAKNIRILMAKDDADPADLTYY